MKREDVKNKIPGITDEQLNWLMQENGADINREKSAATALQTQLNNVNAQLKTAQEGLAKFDGKKKPEEYEAELAKLQADLKAQADGFAFDNALDTAILGKKGRIARQQPRSGYYETFYRASRNRNYRCQEYVRCRVCQAYTEHRPDRESGRVG